MQRHRAGQLGVMRGRPHRLGGAAPCSLSPAGDGVTKRRGACRGPAAAARGAVAGPLHTPERTVT